MSQRKYMRTVSQNVPISSYLCWWTFQKIAKTHVYIYIHMHVHIHIYLYTYTSIHIQIRVIYTSPKYNSGNVNIAIQFTKHYAAITSFSSILFLYEENPPSSVDSLVRSGAQMSSWVVVNCGYCVSKMRALKHKSWSCLKAADALASWKRSDHLFPTPPPKKKKINKLKKNKKKIKIKNKDNWCYVVSNGAKILPGKLISQWSKYHSKYLWCVGY